MIHNLNNETVFGTRAYHLRQGLLSLLVTLIALTALAAVARGQETSSPRPASPTPTAEVSLTAAPGPTPIPLAEVVTQAETASANLRALEADLASAQITATVDAELPVLVQDIDARLSENEKILNSRPSLETLKNLETEWKTLADKAGCLETRL